MQKQFSLFKQKPIMQKTMPLSCNNGVIQLKYVGQEFSQGWTESETSMQLARDRNLCSPQDTKAERSNL